MILGVFRQQPTQAATPMALDVSAFSELLAALRAGDGVGLIRDAVRPVMQELIELEAAEPPWPPWRPGRFSFRRAR